MFSMAGALRASASALQASPLRTLPSASRFSATVSRASSSSSSSPVAALRSSFAGAAVPRSGRKAAASPAQTETRRAFMGTTTSAATFEGKTFYDFEVEVRILPSETPIFQRIFPWNSDGEECRHGYLSFCPQFLRLGFQEDVCHLQPGALS